MTQQEITEGNKLIAEFMGFERIMHSSGLVYIYRHIDKFGSYMETSFKYHSSWNWLMPVVDKIEDLDFSKNLGYSVTIVQFVCLIKRNNSIDSKRALIIDSPAGSKINATWRGVIQFIKWHNTNTTTS